MKMIKGPVLNHYYYQSLSNPKSTYLGFHRGRSFKSTCLTTNLKWFRY